MLALEMRHALNLVYSSGIIDSAKLFTPEVAFPLFVFHVVMSLHAFADNSVWFGDRIPSFIASSCGPVGD